MFAATDEDGYIFLDRNGDLFAVVLEWLRTRTLPQTAHWEALLQEARYFAIQSLVKAIEEKMGGKETSSTSPSSSVSFDASTEERRTAYGSHYSLILRLRYGGRLWSSEKIERVGMLGQRVGPLAENFRAGIFKIEQPTAGIMVVSIPYDLQQAAPMSFVLTEK